MRIEYRFLKKDIEEELEAFSSDPIDDQRIPQSDPETIDLFARKIVYARRDALAKKRAKGLCMPVSEYESLAERTKKLAEVFRMDYLSEIKNGRAKLILTGRSIDLSEDEHPELIEALSLALSRADRLFIESALQYDMPVFELTMLYDLSE